MYITITLKWARTHKNLHTMTYQHDTLGPLRHFVCERIYSICYSFSKADYLDTSQQIS